MNGSRAVRASVLGSSLLLFAGCASTGVNTKASTTQPRADAVISDYFAAAVTPVPAELVTRFSLDTTFYRKYANAVGVPIISSSLVPDEALLVARDIVTHMLSARPDIRSDLIAKGGRVGIMAITEMTTDIPEQRDWKKPALDDRRLTDGERARYNEPGGIGSMTDKEYWNRRARGMGGTFTTGAEENVLGYPDTRYYGEHILVHEFSHNVHGSIRRVDPELQKELEEAYRQATEKKMYINARGGRHYAVNTIAEYFAEGTQWWFWNNYPETFVTNGAEHRVWSPEDLKAYDPKLYDILSRVYPDHHIPMDVYHGKDLRAASRASRASR